MLGTTSVIDRWLWRWGVLDPRSPKRVNLRILTGIVGFHLLALLACVPWLFSWSGLAWAVGGLYLFGTLGINIGYHRLLTHRGFACPHWLEHGLSVIGACCWQGSPMNWVAIHRMHHQHSDEPPDPHSPRTGFFWSHMGWFLIYDPAIYNLSTYDRYARDLFQDRFYKWLERPRVWRNLHILQWAVFLSLGALVGGLWTWSLWGALQLGLSWLVWGVFLRTVAVWHITWSVNSVTHIWGYRNFPTHDDSRNNWLVGFISNGEGWHNNHHAEPRSAAHGQRWWELDVSYRTIRLLEGVGLAWDVIKPGGAERSNILKSQRPPERLSANPDGDIRSQRRRLTVAKKHSRAGDYAVYLLVRTIVCIIQTLSWRGALALARGLAWLAYRIDRRHRLVAADNLRQAFKDLDEAAVDRLVRASYLHLTTLLVEIIRLPRVLRRSNLYDFVQHANPGDLDVVRDWSVAGRPLLVLTGHFGNWEMLSYVTGMVGFRGGIVARRLDNPYLERFLASFRRNTGQTMLDKNADYRRILELMEHGPGLGMVGDQDAGPRGLFVNFFGRPASTFKSITLLSLQYNAPILVFGAARIGSPMRYRIYFEDLILPEDYAGRADAPRAMTERCMRALEGLVRRHPEQYFWLHRRWKHQPKERTGKRVA